MREEYTSGKKNVVYIFDGERRVAVRLKKYLRPARARFERSGNLWNDNIRESRLLQCDTYTPRNASLMVPDASVMLPHRPRRAL